MALSSDAEGYDDYLALHFCTVTTTPMGGEEEHKEAQPPQHVYSTVQYFSGLAVVQQDTATRQGLDENRLDGLAKNIHGWEKLSTDRSTAAMASYSRQDMRLNFWLSTRTVGSYLDHHPHQEKTQLYRREVDMEEAEAIFVNPRVHILPGVVINQRREHDKKRKSRREEPDEKRACRYGSNCRKRDCQFCPYRRSMMSLFQQMRNQTGCWCDHP
jgi:hypothetical protein